MDITNKYVRQVFYYDETGAKHPVHIDVYDVLTAFGVTCPATAHAIKKLLCSGLRGNKDKETDLRESIVSIERAIELAREANPQHLVRADENNTSNKS